MKGTLVSKQCRIPHGSELFLRYLPQVGTYVALGAYDGITHSNFHEMALSGWTGYAVEPIIQYAQACKVNFWIPGTTVYRLAVSDKEEELEFHVCGEWTSARPEIIKLIQSNNLPEADLPYRGETQKVQAVPTGEFLHHVGVPQGFDFLNISVGGFELKAIKSAQLDYFQPTMVIVDLKAGSTFWNAFSWNVAEAAQVQDIMKNWHYYQVWSDAYNTVFVHERSAAKGIKMLPEWYTRAKQKVESYSYYRV